MRYRVTRGEQPRVLPDAFRRQLRVQRAGMGSVSGNWVQGAGTTDQKPDKAMVTADGDSIWYHPWLMVKFTKLKWLQLKGFDQTAAMSDFEADVYESLRGKDAGRKSCLWCRQQTPPFFIGPWSVPDGSWSRLNGTSRRRRSRHHDCPSPHGRGELLRLLFGTLPPRMRSASSTLVAGVRLLAP